MGADIADLLKAVQDNAVKLGLAWSLRPGTVTGVSNPGALSVRMDGPDGPAGDPIPVTPLSAWPATEQRVFVLSTPDGGNYAFASFAASPIKRGVHSATPDASGYTTVTHGAGFTPTVVLIQPISPITGAPTFGQSIADSYTSTTFRVRCIATGGPAITTPVSFGWAVLP